MSGGSAAGGMSGPASTSRTLRRRSSDSRAARTHPAVPAPTMTTSIGFIDQSAQARAPRIKGITQRVSEVVQGDQQDRQRDAGPQAIPRRLTQVGATVVEHATPARLRRPDAEPQERQSRLGQDGKA